MSILTVADVTASLPHLSSRSDLALLVGAANDHLHRLTARRVITPVAPVEEYLDGHNRRDLLLSEFPVAGLALEIDGVVVDPTTYRVGSRGLVRRLGHDVWPCGNQNIRATYTAGTATPPQSLVLAGLMLVQSMSSHASEQAGLKRFETGDYKEEWFADLDERTGLAVANLIQDHKRL